MQEDRILAAIQVIRQKAKTGYTGKIEINMNDGGITAVKSHQNIDLDCVLSESEVRKEKNGNQV